MRSAKHSNEPPVLVEFTLADAKIYGAITNSSHMASLHGAVTPLLQSYLVDSSSSQQLIPVAKTLVKRLVTFFRAVEQLSEVSRLTSFDTVSTCS